MPRHAYDQTREKAVAKQQLAHRLSCILLVLLCCVHPIRVRLNHLFMQLWWIELLSRRYIDRLDMGSDQTEYLSLFNI